MTGTPGNEVEVNEGSMEPPETGQPQPVGRQLFAADLDEPWFKSMIRGVRETIHPPKLPPLEVTSRPVEDAGIGGMQKEQSWFQAFWTNIRDFVRPPKLPPLEVTSKPVEVGSIWGAYKGGEKRSGAVSLLIHIAIILLLLFAFQTHAVRRVIHAGQVIYLPPWHPKLPPAAKRAKGGGGQKTPKPVSKGTPPPPAIKQFVPPTPIVPKPKLPVTPEITAPAPPIVAQNYADPLSKISPFSAGQGNGAGLGSGQGDGYRNGAGGNFGGGVYQIGGDVSEPVLLVKVEPEYSEEARKAKYSGTVLLSIIVDKNGMPRNIKVIRPLGLGLDQKAIEAVQQWRFKPAMKDGHPVAVQANVEVNFRLL